MKKLLIALTVLAFASTAYAVPILQVGAPAGSGDSGIYADYKANTTNPTETDTAITSGSKLLVSGEYSVDNKTGAQVEKLLGGQYAGGKNWSDFGFAAAFNTAGAVLMATVPDGTLARPATAPWSFTIDGNAPIYQNAGYEVGFTVPNPPANHDPIKEQDYLFFDVGNFAFLQFIPNFVDESPGTKKGEIKSLTLGISGLEWVHFDVFALLTDQQGKTELRTTLEGNPGSKDVTWKTDGGIPPQEVVVPEPSTIALLGVGFAAMGLYRRKRRN